jgi:ABC-2 type transport system ATP-binding protein
MKVSLLLTLAWRPRVLILDEPTVGLDAISKQQVFAELLRAVHDENRTVVISSHSLSDLERLTDHVGMIKNGRMVFEGSTAEVVERYRMVDVIASQPVDLRARPGVVVQTNEGSRWRLLVDQRTASPEKLGSLGLTLVSDGPVSLEDLFVALGKD